MVLFLALFISGLVIKIACANHFFLAPFQSHSLQCNSFQQQSIHSRIKPFHSIYSLCIHKFHSWLFHFWLLNSNKLNWNLIETEMELNWMSSVWILNFISLNSVAVWLNEARNQKAELGSEMKNEFWLKKEEWMISFQDIRMDS